MFGRDSGGGGAWGLITKIHNPGDTSFGHDVAISGDTVVVLSLGANVFKRDIGGSNRFGFVTRLIPNLTFGFPAFSSVAICGDTVFAGAHRDQAQTGSAFAYVPVASIPVVNTSVALPVLGTSTRCCTGFTLMTELTNTTGVPIRHPFFEVTALTRGELQTRDPDTDMTTVGATQTPALDDDLLSPGESVAVTFVIFLPESKPFRFIVNVRGEPER